MLVQILPYTPFRAKSFSSLVLASKTCELMLNSAEGAYSVMANAGRCLVPVSDIVEASLTTRDVQHT